MQLGFVSAILPELSLEEVLAFTAEEGFACVELMCWPVGAADRRYAGVTHLDVTRLDDPALARVRELLQKYRVSISGLGYYPNPLDPDPAHRRQVVEHLKRVIVAAARLQVRLVNTFIGRDPQHAIEDNWPLFLEVWSDLVGFAEREGVRLAIENCPMLFSRDEWPGGKNLAISPAVWRAIFEALPGPCLGLNFDPSHLIWQHIDYLRAAREFSQRIYHFHAKDTRIDPDRLYERGILGLGWHIPKLPGLGAVNWGALIGVLGDAGYRGPVCIEVEDRTFEDSLASRQRALRQSLRYLRQFIS